MAATDQPYRSPKTLDLIFGVSCGLMLLTTLWMLWADYAREWKTEQRTFRDVEASIAERDMIDRMPDAATVAAQRDAAKDARKYLEERQRELAPKERNLKAQYENLDAAYRDVKADYDAQMSYFNIAADLVSKEPADSSRHKSLKADEDNARKKLDELDAKLAKAKEKLDGIELKIKQELRRELEPLEKTVSEREEELKRTTGLFDRYAKQVAKTNWTFGDTFRALPIVDGFESPTKIKQIWLPELTIDYSFKEVPRYDRCTTCHLGIDRSNYDKATLAKLTDEEESRRLSGKLVSAQKLLEQRAEAGENLGFDPADFPSERRGSYATLGLILLGCIFIAAISLGVLQQSIRLAMMALVVGFAIALLSTAAIAGFYAFGPQRVVKTMKAPPVVRTVKNLTDGQVTQFCAHPRLDLFVDSNSPHPMEKFGCTICHAGQGSATEFLNATHSPDGTIQEHAWKKKYGWETQHAGEFPPNYHWDYPMLQKRFLESSCLKCHHQVTDLIRQGSKEEAPKLLRGYNLIKEMGCFGCHEIQGVKSGRWVGPDLRLESSPALDWMSAADQERIKSDSANPPGTLRKVGPSLRRLSEKVGEEWTKQWINDPRGFRDDTRMPHFYNLSTNNKDYLEAEDKDRKDKQANFPATEINAISHYLMHESRQHLKGEDYYRQVLLSGKKNLIELQKELVKSSLSDRDIKDLFDVSKRFSDLALLSNPTQSTAINANASRQRQLQDRLQELHRKLKQGEDAKAVQTEIASAGKELDTVTESLRKLALATPLSPDRLTGHDGATVALPREAGDAANGRTLFVEKGCMACHAHEDTAKAGKTPAVTSEASFGPELSRMANKLLMGQDGEKARLWLVQWVMNPNVYHPRTRMPITHLSPKDANDVAAWILSNKKDWKGKDPGNTDDAAIRALARLNLSKAPGFTKADVDAFLPVEGKMPGIPKERAATLPRDSDERELAEDRLSDAKLLWYIGKRAVGRLGCYGCHDIPGFETAKPIGTGLNDWGKKDHDKLAFEDGVAYAKEHFAVIASRTTRKQVEDRILALWKKGGEQLPEAEKNKFTEWVPTVKDVSKFVETGEKHEALTPAVEKLGTNDGKELAKLIAQIQAQPKLDDLAKKKQTKEGLTKQEKKEYEELHALQFFGPVEVEIDGKKVTKTPVEEAYYHALEHHHREGFLNLKLMEPRSYDINRIKAWDDRLRMPQFSFARSRKKVGESNEQHAARLAAEEADAREAVMTFILGLVAEPVPLKYVNNPKPEKAAEGLGRQVLEKYNCGGCHQIRPGVYDFDSKDVMAKLMKSHDLQKNQQDDYHFPNTNAWVGPAPVSDKMTVYGLLDRKATTAAQDVEGLEGTVAIRLTDALKFVGSDKVERTLPASTFAYLPEGKFTGSTPYGGTWTALMTPYLTAKSKDRFATPPSHLPPPLIRQGERVQPDWLYRFLLNPGEIRPETYMVLRMPKFNMSPDEARALVNYFAASAKTSNPAQGVTYPYVQIPQRDQEFWKHAAEEYRTRVDTTAKEAAKDADRIKAEMKKAEEDAKDEKKKDAATKRLEELKKDLAAAETREKNAKDLLAEKPVAGLKVATDLYSRNAYKLLTNRDLCLKCHNIGNVKIEGPQGPNLSLSAERLRPDWTEQWIARPPRLFPYDPVMPQNFPNKPDPLQWIEQKSFVGSPYQQTRAVRDILMDSARLSDLLANVPPPPPPPPTGEKKQ